MSRLVQVTLTAPAEREAALSEQLEACGALSVSVTGAGDEPLFEGAPGRPGWTHHRLCALFPAPGDLDELVARIRVRGGVDAPLEIAALADRDWEKSVLAGFEPMQVGERLWVHPRWCEPVDPRAVNVIIDPGMAFGTGTHDTTRLCLEYLAGTQPRGLRVADVGCGSGILAIAALKLGARQALAIDNDPTALAVCAGNAIINGVDAGLRLDSRVSVLRDGDQPVYDLVVANILADTLVGMADLLSGCVGSGGTILLSGILRDQVEEVSGAFPGHVTFSERTRGEWALMIGRVDRPAE